MRIGRSSVTRTSAIGVRHPASPITSDSPDHHGHRRLTTWANGRIRGPRNIPVLLGT
jgi:hypothetical protein